MAAGRRRRLDLAGLTLVGLVAAGLASPGSGAVAATPRVLRVGTFNGIAGDQPSIQAAVAAAQPGDWVLVGPGDYRGREAASGDGLDIATAGVHLRGMDRNSVVIDGAKAGSGAGACPADPTAQGARGTNGIVVRRVDGVSVENLTVCNFLADDGGGGGNQIWFNGGDGSGQIHMHEYRGAFLTATSSVGSPTSGVGKYGIFASNASGPGEIADSYASNMGDSAFYVGACPDCGTALRRVHGTNSALGYSGTNGGGRLAIEDSEFDRNQAGIVPNSLNNDDAPSPQDGACPTGVTPPPGLATCTVIRRNHVHDNNNPDTPRAGIAGSAPVGTGIEISGGRNDTITDNLVEDNGSFGIVVHDYPDTETPAAVATCRGGTAVGDRGSVLCYFSAQGNRVLNNRLRHNGFFANPGNADLANASVQPLPGNCFVGNRDVGPGPGGEPSSDPPAIEVVDGICGGPAPGGALGVAQLYCASGGYTPNPAIPPGCPDSPVSHYPQPSPTGFRLLAVPTHEATMPIPCAGVPVNPWCP
ncbi:MAG: right-handed parallel beta-helix repeat-containing protein [Acidimicrobiales bacterium]